MTDKELREVVNKSDSSALEPLRRLFHFMDYLNEEHKKENDGQESPYLNQNIDLGAKLK